MKSILFTLIILFTVGLTACRKDKNYPDIKAYDQQQIAAYIAANGITDMQKDTSGHSKGTDTTGIWYHIITQGTGVAVDYPSQVSYVYTMKSFDGKYDLTDTIVNHYDGLLGHTSFNIPSGLILAVHNILKYKGGKMRVLIPSHLAFGVNGSGSGSSTVANTRVLGNQCIDYTIELIDSQGKYDDEVIQTYLTANSLTGYVRSSDSLWYKIIKPGTAPLIDMNSGVTLNYTGALLNHTFFDNQYVSTTAVFPDLSLSAPGFLEGMLKIGNGGVISMLIPSRLAYGPGGSAGIVEPIPPDECLRFEVTVTAVTN
jgi:FKBP-type peptidyl-prolyl cis-trans isomerase FkpA